jgi:hypothetical protein
VSAVSYPADGILNRLRSGRRDGTLAAKFFGGACSSQHSAISRTAMFARRVADLQPWHAGHSASQQIHILPL